MTVLQALAERYDRLAADGKVPVPGYGPAQIGFAVVLDAEGGVVTVDDLRVGDTEKKKRPQTLEAPQPPKRTVAVASGAFWDKTSYVFGRSAVDPKLSPEKQARAEARTAQEHAAFKARHEAMIGNDLDPGLVALLRFLRRWKPEDYEGLRHAEAMLDGNVVFRLDGDFPLIHERPAARAAFQNGASAGDVEGACLVTGRIGPIARLHPSIKGVPGAQSSGAALVSFNLDAFSSYGKQQGFNAPVSEAAAFAYATALNALLVATTGRDDKGRPRWSNRIALGEDTVVFWVENPALEALARGLVEPPDDDAEDEEPAASTAGDEEAVRDKLKRLEAGESVDSVIRGLDRDARVYILGLSPNAARLSVRFWLDQSLGELAQHIQQHWKDLDIRPAPRGGKPKLWALLYEIAPLRKPDKGIQHLAGEMTRAILAGTPYPASLLTQALMRVRVEKVKTTPNRVSLIKTVLARQDRRAFLARHPHDEWKDDLVALDRDEPNVGYRLGRLFAVLDAAQYAGIGAVNATVKDKFFAAASSTPGHIFPILLRGVQDHLATARKKNKKGRAYRLDGEIREILAGIAPADAFPATLSREDQGRFVVGFYHQDADLRTPRAKDEEVEVRTADTDATDSEDEDN